MKPIFEYDDYRAFLRDYYESSKQTKRSFTHRSFAAKAGLSSPTHLRLVMSGARNLTYKTLPKFARGLGLSEQEAEYFENLVYFTQARSSSEKSRYLSKIARTRTSGAPATEVTRRQEKSLFYKWYYAPIYELVSVTDFSENAAWISKRLGRTITPVEARKALKDLEDAGLLRRNEAGRLRPATYKIRTDDEIESLLRREYYRKMGALALDRVDDPLDEREFGFVTVATSQERLAKEKMLAKEFVKAMNEVMTCSDGEAATEVVQMNVQLFYLTKP